ncbi:DUF642 domain-containing protein [Nocardioides albidus]|nr:DUF642 domain-containing protein [Nocardioides albidus]
MKLKTCAAGAAALALVALAGPASAATDHLPAGAGDFSTAPLPPDGSPQILHTGDTGLAPWSVTGSVDYATSATYPLPSGDTTGYAVDLNGDAPGQLSIALQSTTAGSWYQVSFDYEENSCETDPGPNTMEVLAGPLGNEQNLGSLSYGGGLTWQHTADNQFRFQAQGNAETIALRSTTPGPCGIVVTNVAVTDTTAPEVPVPAMDTAVAATGAVVATALGLGAWLLRRRRSATA